ncbi:hypothetical protein [Paenibacillus sp. MMS18-CY102]|uniref:hypothetical protein n=1 Tax=Paenibacillus sp. MMS18-CY102 TaxID=2682849 RepID=UPI0013652F92|nr:hypothetical protein [Paenibacillus sp. MMS18-CY102]MWC30227.1 hypothetical protein [Paenibacillus sp. MMS18-CY102]
MIMYEIINSNLNQVKLFDHDLVIQEIEGVIEQFELNITQKTTLSTLKGSVHYHLKQGKKAGVLEITYWPAKHRLWVEIHDNRSSEWNRLVIKPFSEALSARFLGEAALMA